MSDKSVPIKDKYMLTVKEATEYFNLGENKLRRIVEEHKGEPFIFYNGQRLLIKRKQFEKILDDIDTI